MYTFSKIYLNFLQFSKLNEQLEFRGSKVNRTVGNQGFQSDSTPVKFSLQNQTDFNFLLKKINVSFTMAIKVSRKIIIRMKNFLSFFSSSFLLLKKHKFIFQNHIFPQFMIHFTKRKWHSLLKIYMIFWYSEFLFVLFVFLFSNLNLSNH